jgi:hypothetical protein
MSVPPGVGRDRTCVNLTPQPWISATTVLLVAARAVNILG